ncbi:cytochrome c oxidase subunit 7A-related protein, mitochondrial-like, partial [Clarias magur]
MYYKISGVTGKLTGSTPASAYFPQGLKPTVPSQPSPMIFALPTKVVSEASPTAEYLGSNKVPELQKIFQ